MKTIEERAREASYANLDRLSPAFEVGYIKGATEQQVIDIDKACEWLRENAYFSVNDNTGSLDEQDLVERFRKEMTTVPCDSSQVEKKGE